VTRIAIRDAVAADFPAIVRLNEDEVQHTSPMDLDRLVYLSSIACRHRVAEVGDEVAAFLIAMRARCGYVNPNFEWFAARYPEFLYVDRIVVSAAHKRLGLGSLLYRDLFQYARENRIDVVTCEYNVLPPNEASRRFHDTAGFHEVGTQWLAGGLKRVSLQAAATGVTS
jgi:predicted GNAT superfamily acetyltransferase